MMTDEQKNSTAGQNAGQNTGEMRGYGLQRVYVKDVSFESPRAPEVFQGEWKPAVSMNLSTRVRPLSEDRHEVILTVTVEAKQGDDVAFLVELQQAGVFHVTGHTEEETKYILGVRSAQNLFPFAREEIANLTMKGGFPQILLQPINFDRVYQQGVQQAAGEA
ncbi:MAG TPA: protein-export chaperone SecB [Gammaproteobacteria bacterium]